MKKAVQKILVTGSSGTVGTRLCEKLLERNYRLIGVDWKPNIWNKKIYEITIRADLRDKASFRDIPADIDLICHLAANARVYKTVQDPNVARDNFETTFNTLNFAREHHIRKFLFTSSRETYGNSDTTVLAEHEARIENSESPYAAAKIGGEALVRAFGQCYDMDFIILRLSNVYGMYDSSDRVIPEFIRCAKENKDLMVFGKEKLLDFTYIDDCISGIIKSIENFDRAKNDTYNIASGKGTPLTKVAQLIQRHMKSSGKVVIKESRTGEVVKFTADISKARAKLGYEPKVGIREGLERAAQWYNSNI